MLVTGQARVVWLWHTCADSMIDRVLFVGAWMYRWEIAEIRSQVSELGGSLTGGVWLCSETYCAKIDTIIWQPCL